MNIKMLKLNKKGLFVFWYIKQTENNFNVSDERPLSLGDSIEDDWATAESSCRRSTQCSSFSSENSFPLATLPSQEATTDCGSSVLRSQNSSPRCNSP